MPGDTIYVTGMANATFNFAYSSGTQNTIASVPTSTTFTITDVQADASTSGGTVLLESSGVNIGHAGALAEQVSEIDVWDSFFSGAGSTQSMSGIKWNQSGNVKNFKFYGGTNASSLFGFNGVASGTFKVGGTIFAGIEKADFFQTKSSVTLIDSVESEPLLGARWISNSSQGNNPQQTVVVGSSWQGGAATDDIVISSGGNIAIIGSQLRNNRTGSSVARVICCGELGNGMYGSLTSIQNWYQNATSAAMPWQDGSANLFFVSPGARANNSVSVTSIGDQGGAGGAMVFLPTNIGAVNKLFSGTPNVTGNVVPFGGFINMQSGDSIKFRNNAGNADVIGVSKDTNDVVQLGDTAGAKTVGPMSVGGVTFATLPSSPNGTVIYCSDCNSTCTAGSSSGRTCFRENNAWTH